MNEDFLNPNRLPPDVRYQRDVTFAGLVNILEAAIRSCDYTPTEIREAAMLAAVRYELYNTHEMRIGISPLPACTCKHRERQHEQECYWYLKREEEELRARMNIQAAGFTSVQIKKIQEPEL